jgi:PAS domain S-box-containing protein
MSAKHGRAPSFRFGALDQDGLQVLWKDGDRALCRGSRLNANGSHTSLLVVLPLAERPSPLTLERLAHEWGLREVLEGAWAARPLELRRDGDRSTLVLEDPGGEPLEELLGDPMAVEGFLRLSIGISTVLGKAHQHGLIHKDIKPTNILVNQATGAVRLTGFGIASLLPRERQALEPPETIAGTLAYMAPEQTGRTSRSIDSRSDLYALGVTFYRMLTGALPFTAADPMELVHSHIARRPAPTSDQRPDLPVAVSALVMKLLAKTVEARYQTAAAVERDLKRCLAGWQAEGRIDDFSLGENDIPDRLLIPEKLYGREREVKILLAAFDRMIESGAPELVLVSGYSGIGKSAVVNELQKSLVPARGLFAAGKFDQYKRDIPYLTLVQAFQSLVRPLLSKSDVDLASWREAILEALGPNGRLMIDLIPELELIVGEQPAIAELPPQDAQRRFQRLLRRLIGVFARPEHPLALFLDDLQWLDTATLELLEHLVTHSEVRHLLLIGAYRDNEVPPANPLLRSIKALRHADAKLTEIVLAPLRIDDVGRLVADAVHCTPKRAQPLAQLVHERTGGNPFFAIQFFTELAEEGLLAFDPLAPAWQWDMDRIRAKSYSDNVVDLMVEKLQRFSATTQEALKQLACLGNVAEIATLAKVNGQTEEALQAALGEAVHAGLIFRQDRAYKFLHDRIQQAAYSLIPDAHRADIHLRIGRAMLASMSAEHVAEHLFDVANQFNRGAWQLIDRDEKVQVAMIDLRVGRKAKTSVAYGSACVYLAAGMALLSESDWDSQYALTFNLWFERAECEFLSGNFESAERLIAELLQRAASKLDQAAVYRLRVFIQTMKSENAQAVASALTCLRLFGIDLPAHPSREEVQAEYDTVWQNLNGRPIESLIDLPLMTDPEVRAVMQMLAVLAGPATFTDFRLFCLLACRMVNVSLRHGMSGASAYAFACLGSVLGPTFHRYREGYRLGRLARDLVEKHGFTAYGTKVSHAMGLAAFWTQSIASVIELRRATTRTATETGDLTFACYGMHQTLTALLVRNDPLDAVWRESETALDFARTAKFRDVVDLIVSQQRFIASMQGRDATFSTFIDEPFDEAAFEAQLTTARTPTVICLYWIRKLKARYLSGNYADALSASDKAKALLGISAVQLQMLDYFYYAALTVTAVFETAAADQQSEWRELLTSHCEQLREWAESYPPTFADKHALVSAEIARLDGRELDAQRLYEQAIQSARNNGFVQYEGLAHELAARFYNGRGFGTIAHAYLRNARHCYSRWGAQGKVRQLDELYPYLWQDGAVPGPTSTIGTSVDHLDLATVIKVSQAVSGETVLAKLIDTIMRMAMAQAGAGRALLILARAAELRLEAEATIDGGTVIVEMRDEAVDETKLPESVLHYVVRTRENVILDDAAAQSPYVADPYVRGRQARSVLCLPLLNQAKLIGVLYLENNLAPGAFPPARTAVLKLLASQAAISIENARLYRDLAEREAKIRRLVDANIIGIFIFAFEGRIIEANDAFLDMVGYERDDLVSGGLSWRDLTPPEWITREEQRWPELMATGSLQPFEKEYIRKDGSLVPVLIGSATFEDKDNQGVAFVLDLSERKRAEAEARESERRYREVQAELAHANRVDTIGQMTASIAHEVKQPISAIIINGQSALRLLAHRPPDLEEVRQALAAIVSDGYRAGDVISRIRALVKGALPRMESFDMNEAIRDVIVITRGEAATHDILIETQFDEDLPLIHGDQVQLQQVLLNLIINAIEAIASLPEGPRELRIRSTKTESGAVSVAVQDSGPGLDPTTPDSVFAAFYTTKPNGMGMGLSICRSIVEAHGGRLAATANLPRGAIFQFTVPTSGDQAK